MTASYGSICQIDWFTEELDATEQLLSKQCEVGNMGPDGDQDRKLAATLSRSLGDGFLQDGEIWWSKTGIENLC